MCYQVNWNLIKEVVVITAAAIGLLIAIYRLVLKPRVRYSIEIPRKKHFQTTDTSTNTSHNEECDVRVIRIQNKSLLPLSAKDLYIHIRTSSIVRGIQQSGIYTATISPTDASEQTKDYTFHLDSLPPGGKLKYKILCWKKDCRGKPFFVDHEVLTVDGKVKKVSKLRGFDDPSPVE